MARLSEADRITMALVAFMATELLSHGEYEAAAATLMLPLARRAVVIVLDVFWTSFTGVPLIRSPRSHAPGGLAALLPAILCAGPRRRRGDLFAALAKEARPPEPSQRLQQTKARLGRAASPMGSAPSAAINLPSAH